MYPFYFPYSGGMRLQWALVVELCVSRKTSLLHRRSLDSSRNSTSLAIVRVECVTSRACKLTGIMVFLENVYESNKCYNEACKYGTSCWRRPSRFKGKQTISPFIFSMPTSAKSFIGSVLLPSKYIRFLKKRVSIFPLLWRHKYRIYFLINWLLRWTLHSVMGMIQVTWCCKLKYGDD